MHIAKITLIALLVAPLAATPAQRPQPTSSAAATSFDTSFARHVAAAKAAMMVASDQALRHAEAAAVLAERMPARSRSAGLATAQWLKGEALTRLGRIDDAKPIIASGLREVVLTQRGTKLHGDLLLARGRIAAIEGDVQDALGDFQDAHNLYRGAGEPRSQAIALQNIGSIYFDAGDFERVLTYYQQSAEAFGGDPALVLAAHNARAMALKELRRLPEAEAQSRAALEAARPLGSPVLEAQALTNLAQIQLLRGAVAGADATIARGLALTTDGEARSWRPFLLAMAARAAFERGAIRQAERLIDETFVGVDLTTTPLPFAKMHDTAQLIYARAGRAELALQHLRAARRLEEQSRELASSNNSALMAARFDFANQDLKIERLERERLQREADSLRLQRTIFFGVTSAGAIIMILLLLAYISVRRSRNAVSSANTELTVVNDRLEAALAAKTAFLATTSHEIRTPLNGILGMTQVILAQRGVPEDLRDRIQLVHGAGETMRGLVDDILDAAKMETGNLALHPREIDFSALIEEASRFWTGQAQSKGLALNMELTSAPHRILADGDRLRQVIANLMSNAIKFTDQGTVALRVTTEDQDGERLVIAVEDSGVGISPADQRHIFEAFRQVDNSKSRRFGGTGLGLSICRKLVEAMDGSLAVRSEPGVGSTFTVTLPLVRVANPEPLATAHGDAGAIGLDTCDLLLIESNPLAQSILRALLTPAVKSLTLVSSGEEAEAAIQDRQFDHIVAEGGSLGPKEPVDAVRHLVETAGGAPVSLLWSSPKSEERAALLRTGIAQLIAKPIAGAELLAALRNARECLDQGTTDQQIPSDTDGDEAAYGC